MYRSIFLTLCFSCIIIIGPHFTLAQSFKTFGNQSWESVSSENFDIFYTGNNRSGAILTARYAEVARYELGVLFDFKPEFRYPIVYGGNEGEVSYSNFENLEGKKIPSIFNLPNLKGVVIHPGTANGHFRRTKQQVANLIINEFTYGDRLGNIMQTQLLFHHAKWYREGLADFVAHGWTYEDETWLNSIRSSDKNIVQMALEGDDKMNQVIRKSIWRYIALDYGESKLSEILYLSSIQHSIESGIISVLGINLNTLTLRWREYINSQSDMQVEGRIKLEELSGAKELSLPPGNALISFAYNQAKNKVAMYLDKQGKHTVYLFDLETENYKPLDISGGYSAMQMLPELRVPMAWSHDGTELTTTVYNKAGYQLATYDLVNETSSFMDIPDNIQQISHISYSHDGKKLAVSALNSGKTDIFTLQTGGSDFRQITDDLFDDLDPSWSLDDNMILFSSNRLEGLTEAQVSPEIYQDNFDLFTWTYENSEARITRLTSTPATNERMPIATSSFEALFKSDESGIQNLNKINIFQKEILPFSNLEQGVYEFEATEKTLSFSTPVAGAYQVFILPHESVSDDNKPETTLYRLEYLSKFQDRQKPVVKPLEKDSSEVLEEELVQIEEPKIEETQEEEEEKESAVRYYIFDEEDVPYESRKANKKDLNRKKKKSKLVQTVFGDEPKPKLSDIEINTTDTRSPWAADYVGLGLIWDPLPHNFKYGLDLSIGYSDLLKNHKLDVRVRPFLNLKNTFADVRYEYLKNRIDLFAEADLRARTFRETSPINNDTSFFRYDRVGVKVGGRLPLNSFSAVSLFGGGYYLSRKDQQLRRPITLSESDILGHAGVLVEFDNVKEAEGFEYRGTRAQIGLDSYFSNNKKDFAFHRLHAEVSHYQQIIHKLVFASRVSASFNLPNTATQFYLGSVPNQVALVEFANNDGQLVRSNSVDTSLNNFSFIDFVMPMRGFYPNTRQGSRYIVGNFELRIPLTRLLKHTLNTNSLYGLEIIPFLDAGTVWVDGNPFSQKKPTDTQFISTGNITVKLQTLKSPFLIGFGSGLRTNILSYTLRTDIAWGLDDGSLQRPILTVSLGNNF